MDSETTKTHNSSELHSGMLLLTNFVHSTSTNCILDADKILLDFSNVKIMQKTFKTYKEMHCLIYPSIAFSNFMQTMETLFCSVFGGVIHQNNLLKTMCKTVENEITELHKCGITQCLQMLHQYVKVYMTVRIHHALKISNISMTYGHKRNRKMLKLCHE